MISKRNTLKTLTALAVAAAFTPSLSFAQVQNDGSANKPLRVVLIPADGGTEDGTKKDFQPVFSAITQATGINFDIKVGQSYSAAVEAMCSGAADIAFYGPATYLQAKARDCAELLALAGELQAWTLKPSGTEGYRTAEVTLGGVDTRELSSRTMESRLQPGLHFIGEVMDVTGWLGGFNFQWAWSSGHAAGQFV